jgi:hypothetical protein
VRRVMEVFSGVTMREDSRDVVRRWLFDLGFLERWDVEGGLLVVVSISGGIFEWGEGGEVHSLIVGGGRGVCS